MIKENLDQVRETINAACIRAGRRPEEARPAYRTLLLEKRELGVWDYGCGYIGI